MPIFTSRFFIQIFTALLKLYPAAFQREFAEEMETVFAARIEDKTKDGGILLALVCVDEYFDLAYHLFSEYLALLKKGILMNKLFSSNFQGNIVWRGILVFGIAYGLGIIFGLVTGLSTTKYNVMGTPQVLFSIVTGIVFSRIPTGIFWLSTPHHKNNWGFLPVLLGMITLHLVILEISIRIDYSRLGNQLYWWEVAVGWPILESVLSGLTFGGLFGWCYRGRQGIIPYGLTCMAASALGDIVQQSSVFLSFNIFRITGDINIIVYQNVGLYIWLIFFVMISGVIFGALLGWQTDQVNKKERPSLLPA